MESALGSKSDSLVCPFCEVDSIRLPAAHAALCEFCGERLSRAVLKTFWQLARLPDAQGDHPCECGHPEMRRLPDGTYHCPACGSEVLPLGASPIDWRSDEHSEAYAAGWIDGRFGARELYRQSEPRQVRRAVRQAGLLWGPPRRPRSGPLRCHQHRDATIVTVGMPRWRTRKKAQESRSSASVSRVNNRGSRRTAMNA
jgi:ribosomal protein L37AE/L43A